VTLWAYGQDGCAFADLKRGTLQFHENSPYPLTADLRDGLANVRRLTRQALSRLWTEQLVKLNLKHASGVNSFYRDLARSLRGTGLTIRIPASQQPPNAPSSAIKSFGRGISAPAAVWPDAPTDLCGAERVVLR
jgi:hypothetical protein